MVTWRGALVTQGRARLDRLSDRHRPPDALPFVMYTLATAAVGHILLQRYDVIPAALSVAAVIALSEGPASPA